MTSAPLLDQEPDADRELRHQALLYTGRNEFVAGIGSFVRDGLDAGEPVLVVLAPERAGVLRTALGEDSDRVYFVGPRQGNGRRPERFIPGWDDYLGRAGGGTTRRVWAVGEPIRVPTSTAELIDGQRYESLLDSAFTGDRPFSLLCPYDTEAIDPAEVEEARRSHSFAHRLGAGRPGEGVPPPDGYTGHHFAEPAAVLEEYDFGAGELAQVRNLVDGHAARLGIGGGRAYDYVLAVDEVAANSIVHGGGSGTLRVWRHGDCLTIEIHDRGVVRRPSAVGRGPRPRWTATAAACGWCTNSATWSRSGRAPPTAPRSGCTSLVSDRVGGDRRADCGRPVMCRRRYRRAGDHRAGDHRAGDHRAGGPRVGPLGVR